ncbi:MAG: hypothetical protein K2J00_05960 [Bacteroidaceae bacterium]|nr:hypothetical protein [Bacteroidaceae bacterium]
MNNRHDTDERKLHGIAATTHGHNPFSVPDRYFDTLPEHVMQRIRRQEAATDDSTAAGRDRRQHRSRLFVRMTAAAALTAFFALTMTYTNIWTPDTSDDTNLFLAHDIEYTDELLDYAMLDNSDIEYYLTEAAY